MTVFVLQGRKKLPPDEAMGPEHIYDHARQLWIDRSTGQPAINSLRTAADPTKFGETLLTATREGADMSEVVALQSTTFGETTFTKTHEGADQGEISSLEASNFGETSITRTMEGADQTETSGSAASTDGRDLTKSSRLPPAAANAAYSHF